MKNLVIETERKIADFFENNVHAPRISSVVSLGYGKCVLGYDAFNLVIEGTEYLTNEDMMDIRSDLGLLDTELQIECVFDSVSKYPNGKVIW